MMGCLAKQKILDDLQIAFNIIVVNKDIPGEYAVPFVVLAVLFDWMDELDRRFLYIYMV
jgi:hypothetical protein